MRRRAKELSEQVRRVDNIDLAFVTDENLIGTWAYADFVQHATDFLPGIQRWPGDRAIKRIRFHENGLIETDMDSESLLLSALTWTNGFIISEPDKTCAGYEIREMDGETYLFLEWKSGDYVYRMAEPWIYVFKKEETV